MRFGVCRRLTSCSGRTVLHHPKNHAKGRGRGTRGRTHATGWILEQEARTIQKRRTREENGEIDPPPRNRNEKARSSGQLRFRKEASKGTVLDRLLGLCFPDPTRIVLHPSRISGSKGPSSAGLCWSSSPASRGLGSVFPGWIRYLLRSIDVLPRSRVRFPFVLASRPHRIGSFPRDLSPPSHRRNRGNGRYYEAFDGRELISEENIFVLGRQEPSDGTQTSRSRSGKGMRSETRTSRRRCHGEPFPLVIHGWTACHPSTRGGWTETPTAVGCETLGVPTHLVDGTSG